MDKEMQDAWFDYRKDYAPEDTNTAYKAFCAGWKAAKEGWEQTGVLR